MIQKDLLRGVAAQISENYEKAEVPMYSDHLHLPNRDKVIGIIKNLQKAKELGDTQADELIEKYSK